MKETLFKGFAAVLVLAIVGPAVFGPAVTVVFHEEVEDFADLARQMNIRNLVSTLYLGPRLLDTFLEVLVVLLAVFGIQFMRGES